MNPIVVTIQDDVVNNAIACKDNEHAEFIFRREANKQGISVDEIDIENGYVMAWNGSICITWPNNPED